MPQYSTVLMHGKRGPVDPHNRPYILTAKILFAALISTKPITHFDFFGKLHHNWTRGEKYGTVEQVVFYRL